MFIKKRGDSSWDTFLGSKGRLGKSGFSRWEFIAVRKPRTLPWGPSTFRKRKKNKESEQENEDQRPREVPLRDVAATPNARRRHWAGWLAVVDNFEEGNSSIYLLWKTSKVLNNWRLSPEVRVHNKILNNH